jgi:hypothetical protein
MKLRTFDDELKACMFDLNALAVQHDARALAAACLSKAAFLYQQLRMLGIETPESLPKIFYFGLQRALEDGEKARIAGTVGGHTADPNAKPN